MASEIVDMMMEAKDRAVAMIMNDWMEAWQRAVNPSDPIGNVALDPAQRMERFVDWSNNGTLDRIEGLSAAVKSPVYNEALAQQVEDTKNSPLIRSA